MKFSFCVEGEKKYGVVSVQGKSERQDKALAHFGKEGRESC